MDPILRMTVQLDPEPATDDHECLACGDAGANYSFTLKTAKGRPGLQVYLHELCAVASAASMVCPDTGPSLLYHPRTETFDALLPMLDVIREYRAEVAGKVLSSDDPKQRTIGWVVEGHTSCAGVTPAKRFAITLSAVKDRQAGTRLLDLRFKYPEPYAPEQVADLWEAIRTPQGRQRIAVWLTGDGPFPTLRTEPPVPS